MIQIFIVDSERLIIDCLFAGFTDETRTMPMFIQGIDDIIQNWFFTRNTYFRFGF